MDTTSGRTTSVWLRGVRFPPLPPLAADAAADVCVIGAGIAGVTTAYHLAREGRSVIVLEDGNVCSGETGRTTAHLVNALDDRYFELERLLGEDAARIAAESHTRAIDRIESIVREEGIDCRFERVDGWLLTPPGGPADVIDREEAAARKFGIGVEKHARAPIPGFDSGPCLRFPRQAQFHPLLYVAGLRVACEREGVRFLRAHATEVKDGDVVRVATAGGPHVDARAVVVATNTPVNDRVEIHTKQAAYRTYVVALRVPRGAVARALFWDTAEPYHYVRLAELPDADPGGPLPAEELLIVGGEDHKTGQAADGDVRFRRLVGWATERFPVGAEEFRWSGQVMEPVDSLGFIGRNPLDENVYVATGDSGNGMTHGTIAGLLLTDLIVGRENAWAQVYEPSRKTLKAFPDWGRENTNAAGEYVDWISPADLKSVADLAPGQAAVLRRGVHRVAAYRDARGVLHQVNAACSHLGGVVRWNAVEGTWDCPVHGSRFDPDGRVLHGPANKDLGPPASGE